LLPKYSYESYYYDELDNRSREERCEREEFRNSKTTEAKLEISKYHKSP